MLEKKLQIKQMVKCWTFKKYGKYVSSVQRNNKLSKFKWTESHGVFSVETFLEMKKKTREHY